MYRIFYAERDTTLYERFPELNSGIDQILELTKNAANTRVDGIIRGETYNSRILIDFGSEITTLKNAIANGNIPEISNHVDSSSVFLTLRASDATDLLQEYTLKAFPISQSWNNGQGYRHDIPQTTEGSSWYYIDSKDQATAWLTGSGTSNWTPGVTNALGGGTWITGSTYEASQSFQNQSPDIRMNVSDIVRHWVTQSNDALTNNGFIIKRISADETSSMHAGSIKFFGRESHTIFVPKLEVRWDDHSTGSLSEISDDLIVPYFKNIKSQYRVSEIARFRVGVRSEFPTRTYSTASVYLSSDVLPVSSSYAIHDYETNESLIPFTSNWADSCTKISSDGNGNYFDLRMDGFLPERHYKIILKCERAGDIQMFDEFYFKVVS